MDPITLAQAGPVAILLVAIAFGYRAFQREDIVTGGSYRRSEARADRAEAALAENTAALSANTGALAENTVALKDVTATVKQSLEQRAVPPGSHA